MKILSNKQISEIISQTIASEGLTKTDLIENVADGISAEITARWPRSKPIMVMAGWGNNGADALASAVMLHEQGYAIDVYLFNINDRIKPECRIFRDRLVSMVDSTLTLHEITGREPFEWPEPSQDCLIIDGLFGAGLTKPLPVSFQMLVRNINESGATVISIDLPSGLFDEWNPSRTSGNVVHADLTLTIGAPRLSFMIEDNADIVGEWKVLDIGLARESVHKAPYSYFFVRKNVIKQYLPPRKPFATKNEYGNLLICGGSTGMYGAPGLSATAALRAGAGRVTVHSSSRGMQVLQTLVPCAMFSEDKGQNFIQNFPETKRYTAVAVGPGIGTDDKTADALEHLLKTYDATTRWLLLDADALNCIAARPRMLDYIPAGTIITPHAGEFDRLFGAQESHEARLRKAIEIAKYYQIFIVLKGRYTAVVRFDGKVFFNSSGCPALATPGSGDVLTGVIASLLAQKYKPEMATIIGCFIHGQAGQIAAARHGDYGVTAMDIAENIGRAIMAITE